MKKRLLLLLVTLLLPLTIQAAEPRAVLVTGASSGIGQRTAQLLAAEGYYVYAGARKQKDLDRLDAMDNVEAVRLDVTVPAEIEAAVRQVTKAGRGLYGVVNNAGVAIMQPLIEVEEDQLDFLFNVNIYGPYRITKAFAPLLIESQGRVVNISSISGILSGALLGPYSMSKHALEAYNDALAKEMAGMGVKVAAVEPGNYDSKIGESAVKQAQDKGLSFEGSLFEKEMAVGLQRVSSRDGMADPMDVAKAVQLALASENPKARYMVVPNQREAEITIRKLLQEMAEMNQDHPYSYDREALVKMLDETLEQL
jgi:NAD(P)-dependent dehydrogenase (short-subunit alcohol dehydrogenase family)